MKWGIACIASIVMQAGDTTYAPGNGSLFSAHSLGQGASLPSFWWRWSVRSEMRCCQLPRTSFFHQTFWWDLKVTSAGVLSFIAKSHSDETIGSWASKELHLHTCLPTQYGQPETSLHIRLLGIIWYKCSSPLGHLWQTQCTRFLLPRVVLWGWMPSLVLRS